MSVEKSEGEDAKTMRPVGILHVAGLLYAMHAPQITQATLRQFEQPVTMTPARHRKQFGSDQNKIRVNALAEALFMAIVLANPKDPQNPCRR
jgi:hypothetical protein